MNSFCKHNNELNNLILPILGKSDKNKSIFKFCGLFLFLINSKISESYAGDLNFRIKLFIYLDFANKDLFKNLIRNCYFLCNMLIDILMPLL